jgi:hypothetical protein
MAGAIEVDLSYVADTGEKLVNRTMAAGDLRRELRGTEEAHRMVLCDGRAARDRFGLDRTGFVFVDHKTAVTDFADPA